MTLIIKNGQIRCPRLNMSSSTGCQLNQVQSILVYGIIKVLIDIPNQEKHCDTHYHNCLQPVCLM